MRVLVSALALSTFLLPAFAQQQPAYLSNPKFQKELAAAREPHQTSADRIGHWKKASKLAGGACLDCLEQLARLQVKSGEFKDAVGSATAMEQLATKPADKAYALGLRGSAWFYMGRDKPKPEQLEQAYASFTAALAADPSLRTILYMQGRTLALLHRDAEARATFTAYVKDAPPNDRLRTRVQHFADDPDLARRKMAPPFTVTTAEGKQFSLDDMGGRVVLVDFWATWCGPCNRELPHIQKIAEQFAGQPFVLISVSWDDDAAKWQAFVDKNNMKWNQYRDADHQLSTAYGVDSIPHYFTIDADGVLQDEQIGGGGDIDAKIKKLVARARAAASSTAAGSSVAGN